MSVSKINHKYSRTHLLKKDATLFNASLVVDAILGSNIIMIISLYNVELVASF